MPIKILRCFQCLEYGHSYFTCEKPQRCTNCSADHHYETSSQNEEGEKVTKFCEEPPKCFQCNQPHKPTSMSCLKNIHAHNIHKNELLKKTPLGEINKKLRTMKKADWNKRPENSVQKSSTATAHPTQTSNMFSALSETSIDSQNYSTADPTIQRYMNQNFQESSYFQTTNQNNQRKWQPTQATAWTGQKMSEQLERVRREKNQTASHQPPAQ